MVIPAPRRRRRTICINGQKEKEWLVLKHLDDGMLIMRRYFADWRWWRGGVSAGQLIVVAILQQLDHDDRGGIMSEMIVKKK